MIDEETYKRELIRMWDILRGDEYKGKGSCDGVYCESVIKNWNEMKERRNKYDD